MNRFTGVVVFAALSFSSSISSAQTPGQITQFQGQSQNVIASMVTSYKNYSQIMLGPYGLLSQRITTGLPTMSALLSLPIYSDFQKNLAVPPNFQSVKSNRDAFYLFNSMMQESRLNLFYSVNQAFGVASTFQNWPAGYTPYGIIVNSCNTDSGSIYVYTKVPGGSVVTYNLNWSTSNWIALTATMIPAPGISN